MRLLTVSLLMSALVALISCSDDGYSSGDGKYSYLTADFCLVHVSASKVADYALADDGRTLQFASGVAAEWAEKGDTLCRALLYYNQKPSASSSGTVEPVALTQVPVLRPVAVSKVKEMLTDPLSVESCWLSADGRYVNLNLLLKTGKPDTDDKVQTVGLVVDGTVASESGASIAKARLYHSQGGVPEYYTVRRYVSIDTRDIAADGLSLVVNTYGGIVEKNILFTR